MVLELVAVVAFAVILLGGKQKREAGWKVVVVIVLMAAAAQGAGVGIMEWLLENDARFFPGWQRDKSFVLCAVSAVVQVVVAGGVAVAAWGLEQEGGYELIPEQGRTK